MKHYLSETFERFKGNRKCGVDFSQMLEAKDEDLERSFTAPSVEIPEEQSIAYENFHNQFQGNTPHCVAYTIAHALSFFLTSKYHERITIQARVIANILIKEGILTKQGARIDHAVEFITLYSQKSGLFGSNRNEYRINEYKTYSRELIPTILLNGYPIVSGTMIKYPMTDSKHYLKPADYTNSVGGHAFMLAPNRRMRPFIFAENSWKNFGIPYRSRLKSGQFKIKNAQISSLFTPHVFVDVEKV